MNVLTDVFDKIEAGPVADKVVEHLEDLLVQGVLVEGDKLPSERDLAEKLGVSRPKVRDALKKLEHRGLLNIRHGEGTFIAQLTNQAMSPALIDLYARHGRAFFDYLEYRQAQEIIAARWAAERATRTDLLEIKRQLAALEDAEKHQDIEAAQEADVLFHSAIVNATQNATLIHMMTSIYMLTRKGVFYNRKHLRSLDGSGAQLLKQHQEITEAILAGNADQAAKAAKDHLDFVEKSVRRGIELTENEIFATKRANRRASAS